jgi:O-antigen ligase
VRFYFPAGTGIGTFDQVFRSVERLDHLSPLYLNQAHNEYLQVLLEAGLPGALLLATTLLWYAIAAMLAWTRGDLLAKTGSIVLGIYLLHSIVDYPLRTLSHAALLGLFAAMMPIQRRQPAPIAEASA